MEHEVREKPTRLPLGRTRNRLSFERRLRLWLLGMALPSLLLAGYVLHAVLNSWPGALGLVALLAVGWAVACGILFEQIVRPMQTLANVVAALREEDFSFRARGGMRGDAMGDLALEINALAGTLQYQRSTALDALTLVERVLSSMQSPVLAFDEGGCLRLLNAAARASFALPQRAGTQDAVGRPAEELGLGDLLAVGDQGRYPSEPGAGTGAGARWSVRRAAFRLHGLPHTLFVLTDLAAALREEERSAWQRLIRVLGHEINNSLTPIKSIAGSLQARLREDGAPSPDMARGLAIIEDRAASLNRFLQAYQRMSRLPAPSLRAVSLRGLVEQVVGLETRLGAAVMPGPELEVLVDPDQMQQALINLLQNAVDAALGEREAAAVEISWKVKGSSVELSITDNGPGITNPANLFVPFYTTKLQGSGIGLVLAQQIVLAHGGSVALRNREGGVGCVAEVVLPVGF